MHPVIVVTIVASLILAEAVPPIHGESLQTLGLLAMGLWVAAIVILAWGISAATQAELRGCWTGSRREDLSGTTLSYDEQDILRRWYRWVELHLYVWMTTGLLTLWGSGWTLVARRGETMGPVSPMSLGMDLLLSPAALLFPLLWTLLLSWACFFEVERSIDSTAVSRRDYVWNQIRLWLLPPVLLIVSAFLWGRGLVLLHLSPFAITVATIAFFSVMVAGFPWLLCTLWRTNSLPNGRLRNQLLFWSDFLSCRTRDIRVWETGAHWVNAAVCGFWGPWRYVILTDGLLETFSDDEVELVFLHEMAHIKLRHGFRMIRAATYGILGMPLQLGALSGSDSALLSGWRIAGIVLFGLGGFLAFIRFARLMELQADRWVVDCALADKAESASKYSALLQKLARTGSHGLLHPTWQTRCRSLSDGKFQTLGRSLFVIEAALVFLPVCSWILFHTMG